MAKLDGISKVGSEKVAAEPVVPAPAPQTLSPAAKAPETAPETPAVNGENYESLFPEPTVSISSPPVWIWWALLLIAALAIGLLGYYVANGKLNQWLSVPASSPTVALDAKATVQPTAGSTTTPTPVATASPTASTLPTATPAPAAIAVSVRVLNGTQTTGAASSAADSLRQAGLAVSGIGNGVSRTHTSTIIYYQTGKLSTAQKVQKTLSSYTSTLQEDSAQTGADTVLVVLGPKQ